MAKRQQVMPEELKRLTLELNQFFTERNVSKRLILEAITLFLVMMFDKSCKNKELRKISFMRFEINKMYDRICDGLKSSGWKQ